MIKLTPLRLAAFMGILAFGVPIFYTVINRYMNTIQGVPSKVNTFLSKKDISTLKEKGFPVYTGKNPPNIQGKYYINKWTVHFDSGNVYPIGTEISKFYYHFANLRPDGTVDVDYYAEDTQDKGEGKGSFISGEGNCFTIYIDQRGNNSGCNYVQPTIISGCLEKNGIKDWNYSNIMKSKDNTQICEDIVMPIGNVRIIIEDDKFVEKVE